MTDVVEFEVGSVLSDDLFVAVEMTGLGSDDLLPASPGGRTRRAAQTFREVLDGIGPSLLDLKRVLETVGPDSVEVELGVKLTGESAVLVAKGSAEAHFIIRLRWSASEGS